MVQRRASPAADAPDSGDQPRTMAAQSSAERVLALLDARMGEVYSGFMSGWAMATCCGDIRVSAPPTSSCRAGAGWVKTTATVVRPIRCSERLQAAAGSGMLRRPNAAVVAALAAAKARAAQGIDAALAAPLTSATRWPKTPSVFERRRSGVSAWPFRLSFPDERARHRRGGGASKPACRFFRGRAAILPYRLESGYSVWVLRLGGDLIGFSVVMSVIDEAHLLNIGVSKRYQGQGYGARLLRHAMECARLGQRGSFSWSAPLQRAAVELYRHFGFRQIGARKGYYPAVIGREDALIFELGWHGLDRSRCSSRWGISPIWVTRDGAAGHGAQCRRCPAENRRAGRPDRLPRPFRPVVPPVAEAGRAGRWLAKGRGRRSRWPALARQSRRMPGLFAVRAAQAAVFGVGDTNPDWLFIGEGPGSEEDAKGSRSSARPANCSTTCWRRSTSPGQPGLYRQCGQVPPARQPAPQAAEMAAWPYLERQILLKLEGHRAAGQGGGPASCATTSRWAACAANPTSSRVSRWW